MNFRRKILIIAFAISFALMLYGYFMINQIHEDFSLAPAIAEFEAFEFNQFIGTLSETERGSLGNNVYAVGGEVESLSRFGFILKGGVVCTTADSTNLGLQEGEEVKVKGRFISFDELLEEVRLDHVVAL